MIPNGVVSTMNYSSEYSSAMICNERNSGGFV